MISPGEFGVAIFFCVSGFIIPYSVRNVSGAGTFGFAINRLFRLYPLYWLCLAFCVLLTPVALPQLLANTTMLQRFLGVPDVNGVFWTLQVEVVFYCMIALVLLFSVTNRGRAFLLSGYGALVLVVACALVRHFLGIKAPIGLFVGLTLMFFVAAHYDNVRTPRFAPGVMHIALVASVIVLSLSWLIAYDRNWGSNEVPFLSTITMIVSYGLAVAVFFLASRLSDRFPAWLTYVGSISYPLYLFHDPLHKLLDRTVESYLGIWETSALAAILTFVVAAALHHGIELPMIALGRSASRRWRAPQRLAVQATRTAA